MSPNNFSDHPAFRRARQLRNRYFLGAFVLNVLVFGLLSCLLFDLVSGGHPEGGYGFVFDLTSWSTLAVLAGMVVSMLVILFGVAQWALVGALKGEGIIELFPEDQSDERKFGQMTGREIVTMVHGVGNAMNATVGRIVVIDQPDPNAFTTYVFGSKNVVALYSNLLEIMPTSGVRAVVAHEVAHIHKSDALRKFLTFLPGPVLTGVYFLCCVDWVVAWHGPGGWWAFFLHGLFLGGLAFGATIAFGLQHWLGVLYSQQDELLADAHAATVCGWESMLNALLLLGERTEAMHVLVGALREVANRHGEPLTETRLYRILSRFPPHEVDENEALLAAPRLYILDILESLRESLGVPITVKQINKYSGRAAQNMGLELEDPAEVGKGEDEDIFEDYEPTSLADWRLFDTNKSGDLDAKQIGKLVVDLQENPKRMLFRQFLTPESELDNHPRMRQRVLFLHEMFSDIMESQPKPSE